MPLIFYISHDGNQYEADVAIGDSVMQGAVTHGIDGILGECGGCQSCGTCHCYIDDAWIEIVGIATGRELEMVSATPTPKKSSRLSCQIQVTEALDGLIVHLPESQY